MASLHIIDQSLRSHGGHHFDYVRCVATAASREIPTFIGTHREFGKTKTEPTLATDLESLDSLATVQRCFRNTTYQRESYLAGLQHLKRCKWLPSDRGSQPAPFHRRFLEQYRGRNFRRKRRTLIAQFAGDMSQYFRACDVHKLGAMDHIFLTTVSELELMGLAIFLTNSPWTVAANWHLQFHYNLFEGRTPEYDSQMQTAKRVRGCFLAALSRLPNHQLNFYVTADELQQQYKRLGIVDMEPLPYPISPRFAPQRSSLAMTLPLNIAEKTAPPKHPIDTPRNRPIRMVCPGELRREKGCVDHLQKIVDPLWHDYLANGRLQLAVQRPKRKWYRRERIELQLPTADQASNQETTPPPVIDYLRHPLSEDQYCDLIREADCGLLLYDSRAYFARRAGVLGELLACGKPVIVPAGCWLAHQIQDSQFEHIETTCETMDLSRKLNLADLKFDLSNVPFSGGKISFDQQRHPFCAQADIQPGENIAVVSFDWQDPTSSGVDTKITVIELAEGDPIVERVQVVGHRQSAGTCRAMFRVDHKTEMIRIEFENAFHNSMATIRNLTVDLYRVADASAVPLSRVGIIMAGAEQLSESVIEMVEHLPHYRDSAEAFSETWYDDHRPQRTVDYLLSRREQLLKVA